MEKENSTIADKIDSMLFSLSLEKRLKCWELIEELIAERINEADLKKSTLSEKTDCICLSAGIDDWAILDGFKPQCGKCGRYLK